MKYKMLAVLLLALLLAGNAFAAGYIEVLQPKDSNYFGNWTAGKSNDVVIIWGYKDATAPGYVDFNIYYGATAGAKTTKIADVNGATVCAPGAISFATLKICKYSWNASALADQNVNIDVNAWYGNGAAQPAVSSDSNTIVIDNATPGITSALAANGQYNLKCSDKEDVNVMWKINSGVWNYATKVSGDYLVDLTNPTDTITFACADQANRWTSETTAVVNYHELTVVQQGGTAGMANLTGAIQNLQGALRNPDGSLNLVLIGGIAIVAFVLFGGKKKRK